MQAGQSNLDIIWGVKAISVAINRTDRVTYRLLETGEIPPAKKVGGRWCVSRRKLVEHFEQVAA